MPEKEFFSLMELVEKDVETAFVLYHRLEEYVRLKDTDVTANAVILADHRFWQQYRSATQAMLIMTIGRLIDTTTGAKDFQALVTATISNPQLFDRQSLGARKMAGSIKPTWWDNYIANAWYPTEAADLRFLQKAYKRIEQHIEEIYIPLRHNVYAHRFMSDEEAGAKLFSRTSREALGIKVAELLDIVTVIRNLYVNGDEPKLGVLDFSNRAAKAREDLAKVMRKLTPPNVNN